MPPPQILNIWSNSLGRSLAVELQENVIRLEDELEWHGRQVSGPASQSVPSWGSEWELDDLIGRPPWRCCVIAIVVPLLITRPPSDSLYWPCWFKLSQYLLRMKISTLKTFKNPWMYTWFDYILPLLPLPPNIYCHCRIMGDYEWLLPIPPFVERTIPELKELLPVKWSSIQATWLLSVSSIKKAVEIGTGRFVTNISIGFNCRCEDFAL